VPANKPPMIDAQSHLSIENLTKSFGNVVAVNGVSLGIDKGEFFSLLGPSGCGKSTLLRMVAGLDAPTTGRIVLDGADITLDPPHRRPTNMMFQSYALFPHLNVVRNITFGLEQDRLPKDEIAKRLKEVSTKLQLASLLERRPSQLSGGQRQRVALARALVKRPKVLLLDEPLGALDKNLRTETQHELVRLQKDLGITFIIVTHDQHEAITVSTRIAIMHSGRVLQIGSPASVYEAPVSRYVAKFLGEANVIDVDAVEERGQEARITIAGSIVKVGAPPPANGGVGKLWLTVRPERVEIAMSGDGLPAIIEEITYTGVQFVYRMRLLNGCTIDSVQINRGTADQLAVGDKVRARWASEAAQLLSE
jgi:putrescine transport system ATP-binding protein